MLPFLKPKVAASVIMAKAKPSGELDVEREEGQPHPGVLAAAESLISAVHSKDASAVAAALEDAFGILDSQPHEEGPHTEEEGA